MQVYRQISKQISVSYLVKAMGIVIGFLFYAAVTRYLSAEEYGILSLFLMTITVIHTLNTYSLRSFFIKYLAGKKIQQKIILMQSIVPFALTICVIMLIVLVLFD